ncbi:MAG: aspartate--tRNA(Asn) ligase [Mariniphaga sp.]
MRTLAQDVPKHLDREITVSGWVHRTRELGQINFVLLRDRSGMVQVVFSEKIDYSPESVLTIRGTVKANEKAPGGAEIHPVQVTVESRADSNLPVQINQDPDKYPLEVLLDQRHLSLRMPKLRAIFQLQSALLKYLSDFMRAEDFYEMKTTKLVGTGAEGGTGLFSVEYFENKVYLAQSPQLYKQAMISTGLERVFEISHAYRAEKHDTPRHVNEYVSFDVEMAFIDSDKDLMEFEARLLDHVFTQVGKNDQALLDLWGASVPAPGAMLKAPIVGHDEAKDIITKATGKKVFEINPEGERALSDWALATQGVDLVFINDWPRKKRAWYSYPSADGTKTLAFDLIFRGLEITSGSRRINDYAMLQDTLPKFGLTEEGLGFYPQIFRYGCPPHGGFAIGLERLTQKILGLANVKEASAFPRDRKRVAP